MQDYGEREQKTMHIFSLKFLLFHWYIVSEKQKPTYSLQTIYKKVNFRSWKYVGDKSRKIKIHFIEILEHNEKKNTKYIFYSASKSSVLKNGI